MAARLPDAFAGVKNDPAQASPFLHLLAITSKDDGPLIDLEGRNQICGIIALVFRYLQHQSQNTAVSY